MAIVRTVLRLVMVTVLRVRRVMAIVRTVLLPATAIARSAPATVRRTEATATAPLVATATPDRSEDRVRPTVEDPPIGAEPATAPHRETALAAMATGLSATLVRTPAEATVIAPLAATATPDPIAAPARRMETRVPARPTATGAVDRTAVVDPIVVVDPTGEVRAAATDSGREMVHRPATTVRRTSVRWS